MSGNEVRHLIKTCTYFVLDLRKYNERVFKEDQSKYIKVVFHEAIAVYLWCDYINHYAVLFSPILKRGLWKDIYNHELMTFVNRPHADPVLDLIVLDFHSDGEQARPDGRSEFLQELFGTTDDTGYKRSGFKCRVTFQNAAETPPPASTLTYEHRSGYGGYAIEVADPSFLLAETFLHLASNKASAPKSSYWNELLVLYGLHDAVGKHAAAHKSAPATVKRCLLEPDQVRQEWKTFLDNDDYAEIRRWVHTTRQSDRDEHHAAALNHFIEIVSPQHIHPQTQSDSTATHRLDDPAYPSELPARPYDPQKRHGIVNVVKRLFAGEGKK